MRYCSNFSILFKEAPFLERFERAKGAGASALEFWWPGGEDLGEVERAIKEADLSAALFNFDAGDMQAGDRALISDPVRQDQFREDVPVALELAQRLGCTRLNALVGQSAGMSREEQLERAGERSVGRASGGGVRPSDWLTD